MEFSEVAVHGFDSEIVQVHLLVGVWKAFKGHLIKQICGYGKNNGNNQKLRLSFRISSSLTLTWLYINKYINILVFVFVFYYYFHSYFVIITNLNFKLFIIVYNC